MKWEELLELSKKNPELFKMVEERSKELLDQSGRGVLTGGGGHLNPDTHIAAKLREGLRNPGATGDGQYPLGRAGFLLKAKAGDMSDIGGPELSENVMRRYKNPRAPITYGRKIRAYNRELDKVMDAIETGDIEGMENTGSLGAEIGRTQQLRYLDRPDAPLDVFTGMKTPTVSQGLEMQSNVESVPDPLKPFLSDVVSRAVPDAVSAPKGDFVRDNIIGAARPMGKPSVFVQSLETPVKTDLPIAKETPINSGPVFAQVTPLAKPTMPIAQPVAKPAMPNALPGLPQSKGMQATRGAMRARSSGAMGGGGGGLLQFLFGGLF